jgi:hypothetical protein
MSHFKLRHKLMNKNNTLHYYYSAHSPLGLFSDGLHQVLRVMKSCLLFFMYLIVKTKAGFPLRPYRTETYW